MSSIGQLDEFKILTFDGQTGLGVSPDSISHNCLENTASACCGFVGLLDSIGHLNAVRKPSLSAHLGVVAL